MERTPDRFLDRLRGGEVNCCVEGANPHQFLERLLVLDVDLEEVDVGAGDVAQTVEDRRFAVGEVVDQRGLMSRLD